MAETWPATVGTNILQDGYSQQAKNTTIRSKMEAGIDKVRRRYTSPIINSTPPMVITYAQYETMETFYHTTLQGGVLPFDFTDPITTNSYEYRFLSPPTYTPFGGLKFIMSMEWERVG